VLAQVATIVTPDTILRWHPLLIARKCHRALRLSDVDPPWDLSPDGVRLVALTGGTETALLLLDLATDGIRTVTSDALRDVRGIAWTRDGTGWIVVHAGRRSRQ